MNNIWKKSKPAPIVIGTGLIALDVIIGTNKKNNFQLKAGGSCGNVLTILSYLGFQSYPIGRLKNDDASNEIIKDLKIWNVKTSFITRTNTGSTPVIIEKIRVYKNGNRKHSFSCKCPTCGAYLSRYKPILSRDVTDLITLLPRGNIFYFDRINRSSIEIAKKCKEQGMMIFLEPCGISNEKQFKECLEVADIVKYSQSFVNNLKNGDIKINVPLIIETSGEDGLRYQFKNSNIKRKWKKMKSYRINNFIDAAGAGDWCSAGIIYYLIKNGFSKINDLSDENVQKAINLGQAFSALNCRYEGARGTMYNLSLKEVQETALEIWELGELLTTTINVDSKENNEISKLFCPDCRNNS